MLTQTVLRGNNLGRFKAALAATLVAATVTACQHDGVNVQAGSVAGSVVGAVAASKIGKGLGQDLAVTIGAFIGLFVGAEITSALNQTDRDKMFDTTQQSLEHKRIDQTTRWINSNSGHTGTITPQSTYKTEAGVYCRAFRQTVTIANRVEEAVGTACRRPDGSWAIVSE